MRSSIPGSRVNVSGVVDHEHRLQVVRRDRGQRRVRGLQDVRQGALELDALKRAGDVAANLPAQRPPFRAEQQADTARDTRKRPAFAGRGKELFACFVVQADGGVGLLDNRLHQVRGKALRVRHHLGAVPRKGNAALGTILAQSSTQDKEVKACIRLVP